MGGETQKRIEKRESLLTTHSCEAMNKGKRIGELEAEQL